MHAAAAAGSPVLVAVLKRAPSAELPECTTIARTLLDSFILPYQLLAPPEALQTSSAALLVNVFWEQVILNPNNAEQSALVAFLLMARFSPQKILVSAE